MGGNRRNRGSHSSSHHQRASDSSSRSSAASQLKMTHRNNQNDIVLTEVQRGLTINWREIGWCGVSLVSLAIFGIVLAIAAGMTISIHFFEKSVVVGNSINAKPHLLSQSASSTQGSKMALSNSHSPRATLLDPIILASNTLIQKKEKNKKHLLDLGTVLTATESGQLNVLMVVEESPPLKSESPQPIDGTNSEDDHDDYHESPSSDLKGSSHMTPEQTNALVPNYSDWLDSQPEIHIREKTIHPTTCKDGSLGFDDWSLLKAAVQEANSISAERFMKWSAYFANVGKQFSAFDDDLLYYEQDVLFRICPGETLKARRGHIFLNAENVVIECDDCTVDVGGTHLAFGPHAKNVLVSGITFRGASSSSLTFFHDGADASFEDCVWIGNSGLSGKYGAVADVNSTSIVNFYRCEIGQGKTRFGTPPPGAASSLSIRA